MITLFRKAGFQTYLVDEFRTRCTCSKCEIGICAKNMVMENTIPSKTGSFSFMDRFVVKTDAVIGIVM